MARENYTYRRKKVIHNRCLSSMVMCKWLGLLVASAFLCGFGQAEVTVIQSGNTQIIETGVVRGLFL
jgi:hypothetical protein